MTLFIKLLQALIGFLVSLFAMETWRSLLGGYSTIIALTLVAGAALRMANPAMLPFAVGTLLGVLAPYAVVYGSKAYLWAVSKWKGYTKDAEGRIVIDAIGVVVH